MTTSHEFFLSVVLLVGLVLVAGCTTTSSPAPVPPLEITIVPTPSALPVVTSPVIATPAPAQCPMENSTRFISINPIPDHFLGSNITFEGTTNLKPGEIFTVQIMPPFNHCSRCQWMIDDSVHSCCGTGIERQVEVRQGGCNINFWSLDVNTSYHDFLHDEYLIEVYRKNDNVNNYSLFKVLEKPKPNPFRFITLNIPEKDTGNEAVRFSGKVNTDYGPGEKLFIQVISDSGAKINSTIPVFFDGTGYSWNFSVKISELSPVTSYFVNITSAHDALVGQNRTFTI